MAYSQQVLNHFRNPKNLGKIDQPDGVGQVGNIICGDVMWLYIKVTKDSTGQDIISDVKFETFGCAAAIATSSMVTELAKGKTLDQALSIKNQDVVDGLGNLPPVKIHCSVLAADGLAQAIYDYYTKHNHPIPEELEKRHQRLIKEKEILQEKYDNWSPRS